MKKAKRRKNKVGVAGGGSNSDSDAPREPIVIHPDTYDNADFRVGSDMN